MGMSGHNHDHHPSFDTPIRMRRTAKTGRAVGLFGGSFNPAHAGHLHVAQTALRSLALDEVWWLVSPQNPLKPKQPSYESRAQSVSALGLGRRMRLSRIEIDNNTRYTADMIKTAQRLHPNTRFVFLMGADNFAQLPRWKRWREIVQTLPIAIIARPAKDGEPHFRARLGQAARQYRSARLPEASAHMIARRAAPAWTYVTAPLSRLSSSAIRDSRR